MADPLHNSEKTLNGQEKYIDILNYGPYTSLRKKHILISLTESLNQDLQNFKERDAI